jgi:hypothetical protein
MRKVSLFFLVAVCLLAITAGDTFQDKIQQVLTKLKKRQAANDELPPLAHVHSEDCGCQTAAPAPPGGGGGPAPPGNFDADGMGSNRNMYGYGYEGNKWGSEYRNHQNKYGYELD